MRLLTCSELVETVWPGIDIAEEFGQGMVKAIHFPTQGFAPRYKLLYIITPSTAASIQAEHRGRVPKINGALFFVTPVGSLTIPLLEDAVTVARPAQVVMDPDTLASDLRADIFPNIKQVMWGGDNEPPADWAERMFLELGTDNL